MDTFSMSDWAALRGSLDVEHPDLEFHECKVPCLVCGDAVDPPPGRAPKVAICGMCREAVMRMRDRLVLDAAAAVAAGMANGMHGIDADAGRILEDNLSDMVADGASAQDKDNDTGYGQ